MGISHDPAGINEKTPLKLSFRMEAVVPVEVLNEASRIKVKHFKGDGLSEKVVARTTAYK